LPQTPLGSLQRFPDSLGVQGPTSKEGAERRGDERALKGGEDKGRVGKGKEGKGPTSKGGNRRGKKWEGENRREGA